MKKALKNILISIICCFCILSLVSCSGGIKGDEAKATINDFFAAIVAEDYDKAESLLHPDRPFDLETAFLNIEKKYNVDFQAGITIEKYTGFYNTFYSSSIGGSSYELSMRTKVGEKTAKFVIKVVKNDSGYGIYDIGFDA